MEKARSKTRRKSKAAQLSLFPHHKSLRQFGGALLKGHAKIARPLSTHETVHLVLKSVQAIGSRSMLHRYNIHKIDKIIRSHAKLCRIRLYHLVNVGNHLHLVIKLDDSREFSKFIRAITGLIARHVLKTERGPAAETPTDRRKKTRFWVARPFTRLVAWGKDYKYITQYMKKNIHDAKRCFIPWGFDSTDPLAIQKLNTG